ncbi:Flavodoxin [uncultured archaeon]|nr:Flavodoxin [uncultured archaeon]
MKALVVYDSQYGNTEQVAKIIASSLDKYGLKTVKVIHVSKAKAPELKGVKVLVVGSPTQRWAPTEAMQAFLENLPDLEGVSATAFDTRFKGPWFLTGSAARTIIKKLEQKGAYILEPPHSFFVKAVEGPLDQWEIPHIESWAAVIADKQAEREALEKKLKEERA